MRRLLQCAPNNYERGRVSLDAPLGRDRVVIQALHRKDYTGLIQTAEDNVTTHMREC
jgi:hypothetical protein